MSAPRRTTAEGGVVLCRPTPKGGRDAIEGVSTKSDGAVMLAARVREAPQDGRANVAVTGDPTALERAVSRGGSRLRAVVAARQPRPT